jgi:hypothetical protein
MFSDFFQNSYVFNIVTFALSILGIVISIWLAIKKYPKRLTLYYESTRPLTTRFLPALSGITLKSKNIDIDTNKDYLITTLFLQNTGGRDFVQQDFQEGIKIKFPQKCRILDVLSVDYPKEIQSIHSLSNNEIDITIKTFKRNEIIRYDILGELSESISLLKNISFQCRGADISKGNIEKVTDKKSVDILGEVILVFFLSICITIIFCFSLGFLGQKAKYQVISYGGEKDTGAVILYSKDTIAYYSPISDNVIGFKFNANDERPEITAYKGRGYSILFLTIVFFCPASLLFMTFVEFQKMRLKRKLEKVF